MLFLLRDCARQQKQGAISAWWISVPLIVPQVRRANLGCQGYQWTAFSARMLLAAAFGLWKSILCSLVGTGQLPMWPLEQTSLPASRSSLPFFGPVCAVSSQAILGQKGQIWLWSVPCPTCDSSVLDIRSSLAFLAQCLIDSGCSTQDRIPKGNIFPLSLREFPAGIFQGYLAFLCCFVCDLVDFQSSATPQVCDYSLIYHPLLWKLVVVPGNC